MAELSDSQHRGLAREIYDRWRAGEAKVHSNRVLGQHH